MNTPDLHHHGDAEVTPGLLDLAVNVFDGPRPAFLERALAESLDAVDRYPDAGPARRALALRHGRPTDEVLPTAGAAEAFGLLARARAWRRPVVVHPQFTEPDVALTAAGHDVGHVLLGADDGFRLDPHAIPAEADLVVVGNPTNPTGVRHPAEVLRGLLRPGRLVVVDEAFLDDGRETLTQDRAAGLVVVRSLTKLWAVPGVRAGYLAGDAEVLAAAEALQPAWAVSTPALHVLRACCTAEADREAASRVRALAAWRAYLLDALAGLGVPRVAHGDAAFVLARPGRGVHAALRARGVAVRRCDTFPGLDDTWVRIACRPPDVTDVLVRELRGVLASGDPARGQAS